jgi:hypothetical protein
MFFSNQFADRNFAAEKFLSASHLIAGVAMLSLVLDPARSGRSSARCWCTACSMSRRSRSPIPSPFAQMKDAQQEFGIVRMGGTIG